MTGTPGEACRRLLERIIHVGPIWAHCGQIAEVDIDTHVVYPRSELQPLIEDAYAELYPEGVVDDGRC